MKNPPNQKAQDEAEGQAAATPSPGESRDVFATAPDIKVGPYSVRRFVDGDFVSLASIGHPLNGIKAIADEDAGYKFVPTGKDCWTLCWIMTRPRKESKALLKSAGKEGVEDAASDEFGDLPIQALYNLMVAILKQINIYAENSICGTLGATSVRATTRLHAPGPPDASISPHPPRKAAHAAGQRAKV